jgi:multidrug efflux pump
MFVRLKDWNERDTKTGTSFAIIERATKAFAHIKEARVFASSPPAISGLGSSAGFDMELQDHAGAGHTALMAARDKLLELAGKNPDLTRVRHNGLDDSPQLQVDIDQRKAQALGVSIADINDTLQTAWGSSYVNDFMDRGRVKKVYVQSAAPFRMLPDDINRWFVRNNSGGMVPFSAFASSHWESGSPRLERYNGYSAVEIIGEASRASVPVPQWTRWKNWCNSYPPGLVWSGRQCLTRSVSPGLRLLHCMRCRCWWYSFALPRSMRAGQCRSRSCWWYRLV